MSDSTLAVKKRTKLGSAESRRLRLQGLVPGVIYGHGAEPASVTIDETILRPFVQSGHKVVDLDVEGSVEKALVRAIQYDVLSRDISHIDFLRIDPNERVTVDVPLEFKGTAVGTLSGGVQEVQLHTLKLDCLAYLIPDSIIVKVGDLKVGDAIHVKDLALPQGGHAQVPGDAIVVHVVAVKVQEILPTTPGAAEPEVVGKKVADDEAADTAKKK